MSRDEIVEILATLASLWPTFPKGSKVGVDSWHAQAVLNHWKRHEVDAAIARVVLHPECKPPSFAEINSAITSQRRRDAAMVKRVEEPYERPPIEKFHEAIARNPIISNLLKQL